MILSVDTPFNPALGLPTLLYDRVDQPGVRLIHDVRRPRSVAAGPLADGALIRNLSRNDAGLTTSVQGGTVSRSPDGALEFPPAGAAFLRCDALAPVIIGQRQSFTLVVWAAATVASDHIAAAGSLENGATPAAAQNAFALEINAVEPGYGISARVWGPDGVERRYGAPVAKKALGVIGQYAMSLTHGSGESVLTLSLDGVARGSTPLAGLTELRAGTYPLQFGHLPGALAGSLIYRAVLYAGPDGAALVQADWETNRAAFGL